VLHCRVCNQNPWFSTAANCRIGILKAEPSLLLGGCLGPCPKVLLRAGVRGQREEVAQPLLAVLQKKTWPLLAVTQKETQAGSAVLQNKTQAGVPVLLLPHPAGNFAKSTPNSTAEPRAHSGFATPKLPITQRAPLCAG
jgi:hypothetical protein